MSKKILHLSNQSQKEMTIYTLSDYQIGWLEAAFQYAYAPDSMQVKIEKIGIDETGKMIVGFKKYGQMITEKIPRIPTP